MPATPAHDELLRACREVVLPLVQADGGELHLVSLGEDVVALHLSGACAGCPGIDLTVRDVIEPALQTAVPSIRVVVTGGAKIPEGATKLEIEA